LLRAGPLSDPAVLQQLQPFLVTAWHGAAVADMPPDVRAVFTRSELSKDPKRLNLFVFLLDHQGRTVHGFHGLPGGARGGDGRSDYAKEIPSGLARLKLPAERPAVNGERALATPDLKAMGAGVPAGVRLFVRLNDGKDPSCSRMPVVEVVPMKAEDWKPLALPEKAKVVEAAALKSWLVQLYPAGIRTADQSKPFTAISGSLKLEPAGADKAGRYALLRGKIRLAKGGDQESAFEGTLQAVLTYGLDTPGVKSVRGVVEGDYLYRLRKTQRMPLVAAIETRPE
jgi:hypothetical protein